MFGFTKGVYGLFEVVRFAWSLLGGSGDLVSKVISTLIWVVSNYNKYSYLSYNPCY